MNPSPPHPAGTGSATGNDADDDAAGVDSGSHDEWLLDEAIAETFPASDPISPACPPAKGSHSP